MRKVLPLTSEGLFVPPEMRSFDREIVIRTPRATIKLAVKPAVLGTYFDQVDASHFGSLEAYPDARNPWLGPDRVKFDPKSSPSQVYRVDLAGERVDRGVGVEADGGSDVDGAEPTCRCCDSPDPRTIHGEFMMGMCRTCSTLIERRMLEHSETIEEAIDYFQETNVLQQLKGLRRRAEGRSIGPDADRSDDGLVTDGGRSVDGSYRAFCAYDWRGRAPGCGWERFTDSEAEAKRLVNEHSDRCVADYERVPRTNPDRPDDGLVTDGGQDVDGTDRFEQCRRVLRKCHLPRVDTASLIEYIDLLEDKGYNDQVNLEPDSLNFNTVFEIGIRAGYACGLREDEDDDLVTDGGQDVRGSRWVRGGYTRNCPDCGHQWAVSDHRFGEVEDRPCPECGYTPGEGEEVFDGSTCPGCGDDLPGNVRNAPVFGFPGQGYCSWKCAACDLITDGGEVQTDHERPDPGDDPFVCSACGAPLGELKRIRGGDYCDSCEREYGMQPPIRRCVHCGTEGPEEHMEAIDVSPDDEYYPEFEFLCRGCADGGESA